ncbi:hypothetical protein IPF37_05980 [bacterium]|nr:MAG: hypothetical protein IPF37_05980 [bacterium]
MKEQQMYELNKIHEEKLKKNFEEKLHHDPQNIDLLFKLAILEIHPPNGDDIKCIAYLEQILALDTDNVQALLLLSYLKHYTLFEHADEHLMNKLTSLKSSSDESDSMLRYAASWFFQFKGDDEKETFSLQESIALDQRNVWSYVYLADNYFTQGKNLEAKELIHKALGNIKKIYTDNEIFEYDEPDLNDFLNHYVKGIYVTPQQVNLIKKRLEK